MKTKYNTEKKSHNLNLIFKNLILTISIMMCTTIFSLLFKQIGFNESNIIVTYILGVVLVAKYTDGYFYSILTSIIIVFTFNFFFTEPFYTFLAYDPDYRITFCIMLIAAIIISTLTVKVKQDAIASSLREKRTEMLYQINKNLIKVKNVNEISEIGSKYLAQLFNRSIIITMITPSNILGQPYVYAYNNDNHISIFQEPIEKQAMLESFKISEPVGLGTNIFVDNSAYYVPIKGQNGTLGVVGISCFNKNLLCEEQKTLLAAITAQIALAIEREQLLEKQQKSKLEVESERLRGNLLRSLSHDLRTPLTGILGTAGTILDNYDVLDKKIIKELLQGLYDDANWLIYSVENILNMTRIDEGKIEIKKNMEAVEEIVAETVSRVKKLTTNHVLKINIPNDLIMLPIDGLLIEQVLINLIDNGVKYTPYDSIIELKAYIKNDKIVFEVSDNGKGIPEDKIPFIFDRFYTCATVNTSGRRGTGLGLAICKSIINAHNGEILAFNNSSGGSTFRFILPLKEDC